MGIHPQYRDAMANMASLLLFLASVQMLVWLFPDWSNSTNIPHYILWHDILELISIVISMLVFAVGWNSRDKTLTVNVVLLASVFFSIGLLDFFHTFSYVGMPDFFSPNDSQKHLNYWLAARLLAAVVILIVVINKWQPIANKKTPLIVFCSMVLLMLLFNWAVINHQNWFPESFVPGKGLTQFKKAMEYTVIGFNLATALLLLTKMSRPQSYKVVLLFGAVSIMAMSEFYFTIYTTMLGTYNILGHLYKVIAYLFIYRAIVVEVIEEPYKLLKISNDDLTAKKTQLSEAQSLAKIGSWQVIFGASPAEDRWTISDQLRQIWGRADDAEIRTQTGFASIPPEDREKTQRLWDAAKKGQGPNQWDHRVLVNGAVKWVHVVVKFVFDEHGNALEASGTNQDITEEKNREWQLALMNIALNGVSEAAYLINQEGNFLYVNDAACQVLGYTREELTGGMGVPDIELGRTKDRMLDHWEELKEKGTVMLEVFHRAKDGKTFPAEVSANYFEYDGHGYNMALVRDITDRKQLEHAKNETLNLITKISNRLPGVVYQFLLRPDGSSCFPYASDAMRDIYRVDPEEVKEDAAKVFAAVHPDDFAGVAASIQKSGAELTPWVYEYRVKFSDGTINWLLGNAMPELQSDGSILWYGFITNINERRQVEEDLRIAATAFESHEGISITDANQHILRVNRAFTEITGYTAEEAIGKDHRILKSGRQSADFYSAMWDSIISKGKWEGEIWNRRKNGDIYPEKLTISAVKNASGAVTNYVSMVSDITRAKAAEDEIRMLAFYDPLTRLPNRRLLLDRLTQAMSFASRSDRNAALLFIDLDNFKTLNDTLGHNFGDLLLQQAAKRLESCVREVDTIARLGGDEFVVMLEDLNTVPVEAAEQAKVVGTKIISVLNQPYQLGTHLYHNTPSIGITLFNNSSQTIEDLLKQADIAMYQSKKAGRNTLHFFDPHMQSAIAARAALESELRTAVELKQFQLYYQIQVCDQRSDGTWKAMGAEALIRWIHPERGVIAPGEFISLAEDTELIFPIGLWVLDAACAQIRLWQDNVLTKNFVLSVNVSAKQFRQADFVAQINAVIQSHAIDPRLLKLELTESLLLHNVTDTIAKMSALKAIGVQFSLDDFGTGYSSLQYLKMLPFEQLKIDQSFVRDLATDGNDRAIVITIIAMAKNLNMNVIAEGVEDQSQLAFLAREGCEHYQGYLFGRPVPVLEFEAQLGAGQICTVA